jgi:hypothetical protein
VPASALPPELEHNNPEHPMGRRCLAVLHCMLCVLAISTSFKPVLAQTQHVEGTAYDRLDLATPESALRAFLNAYKAGDYVTVFWIFSPGAQLDWQRALYSFNFAILMHGNPMGQRALLDELLPPLDKVEQQDISFAFATLMNAAQRHGMLPLDVTGLPENMSAANVPDLGKRTQTPDGQVDIAVVLKAYAGPVHFRMETSPLGRWRVRQVIPPDGDPDTPVFGVKVH